MNINEYKKLQKEIDKQSFGESYKSLNKVLRVLSVLGNFGSMFLASFFISQLIANSVTAINQPWITWGITLTLLGSLELIKRFVFDKFSLEFVKRKSIFKKQVIGLAFFSLAIIAMSFYSSLNGAQEFSSKSDVLENVAETDIKVYTDSLNNVYQVDIDELEDEIKGYKVKIEDKDEEQAVINESLQERGYLYRSEKDRNKQLTDEKEKLEVKIEKNETEVEELEIERDTEIAEYESKVTNETSDEKDQNKGNSVIFIGISTIIEFLILIGIYFNKYYIFRSYTDMRKKINNDPNYQRWTIYSDILNILYMDHDGGDMTKLPTQKNIWDLCKIQDLPMTKSDLSDFMKIAEGLKITKTKGSAKFLTKTKEEADELLQKHFGVE
ncbi:MAG: hypothetical protein SLAVMIC_00446 [uncultured marine phage]|uniref:Uncharacterized protein n=1 Tax=uncultured marine phage TaxID=707152 RepID=A0A8D9CE73_9VIRU|nr:MAG: hypothetical protein SLAVMIC_00446 [uncultured marine phage]